MQTHDSRSAICHPPNSCHVGENLWQPLREHLKTQFPKHAVYVIADSQSGGNLRAGSRNNSLPLIRDFGDCCNFLPESRTNAGRKKMRWKMHCSHKKPDGTPFWSRLAAASGRSGGLRGSNAASWCRWCICPHAWRWSIAVSAEKPASIIPPGKI